MRWSAGRRTVFCLALLVAISSQTCSKRQRLTQAIKTADTLVARGDASLIARQWEEARTSYIGANQLLERVAKIAESEGAVLKKAKVKTDAAVQLRLQAFESPEGSVRAALGLIGSGDNDGFIDVFWDFPSMAETAAGPERWNKISAATRERFIALGLAEIKTVLTQNRQIFSESTVAFDDQDIQGDEARLKGQWSYGTMSFGVEMTLQKAGLIWPISDMTIGIFGFSLTNLLSRGLGLLETMGPLEETLNKEDARATLNKAFAMAFDERADGSDRKKEMTLLAADTPFRLESGEVYALHTRTVVELQGEKRMVDGQAQVNARVLGRVRLKDGSEAASGALVGWIDESALSQTGESDMWAQ